MSVVNFIHTGKKRKTTTLNEERVFLTLINYPTMLICGAFLVTFTILYIIWFATLLVEVSRICL